MKLKTYTPTSKGVLYEVVVEEEKTEGGIYLPTDERTKSLVIKGPDTIFASGETLFDGSKMDIGDLVVVKVGKDVVEIHEGDVIVLQDGVTGKRIELDDKDYFQVLEHYVIGYDRVENTLTIDDFKTGKEELAGEIELNEEFLAELHGSKKVLY